MTKRDVLSEYLDWLLDFVHDRHLYDSLLTHLHRIPFRYSIPKDENRAEDGISLRYRYALLHYEDDEELMDFVLRQLDGPCSVLEMMVALAIRCEEDITDNPAIGNRVGQWFWGMIVSLGLGSMRDDRYDESTVDDAINTFLNRDYSPDGRGGLFTIKHCDRDLRTVEIWRQLCWYLDSFT